RYSALPVQLRSLLPLSPTTIRLLISLLPIASCQSLKLSPRSMTIATPAPAAPGLVAKTTMSPPRPTNPELPSARDVVVSTHNHLAIGKIVWKTIYHEQSEEKLDSITEQDISQRIQYGMTHVARVMPKSHASDRQEKNSDILTEHNPSQGTQDDVKDMAQTSKAYPVDNQPNLQLIHPALWESVDENPPSIHIEVPNLTHNSNDSETDGLSQQDLVAAFDALADGFYAQVMRSHDEYFKQFIKARMLELFYYNQHDSVFTRVSQWYYLAIFNPKASRVSHAIPEIDASKALQSLSGEVDNEPRHEVFSILPLTKADTIGHIGALAEKRKAVEQELGRLQAKEQPSNNAEVVKLRDLPAELELLKYRIAVIGSWEVKFSDQRTKEPAKEQPDTSGKATMRDQSEVSHTEEGSLTS
ncbi:hypothetical protein F5Y16DRAFT_421008, partial [Xylariaceae sp. FL0255]